MNADVAANRALRLITEHFVGVKTDGYAHSMVQRPTLHTLGYFGDGVKTDDGWKRSRGRPRKNWAVHIHEDASTTPSVLWSQKVGKDHGAARRSSDIM